MQNKIDKSNKLANEEIPIYKYNCHYKVTIESGLGHPPPPLHIIQLPAAPYRVHLLAVEETPTMRSNELLFTYLIISTGISNRRINWNQ